MGERHDLALEPAGWDAARLRRRRLAAGPGPRARRARPLVAEPDPPVRVHRGARPRASLTRRPRRAHRRLRPEPRRLGAAQLDGAAGARRSVIRHGEVLDGRRQPVHRQPAHAPGHRRVHHRRHGGAEISSRGSPSTASATSRSPATPATSTAADVTARRRRTPTLPAAGTFECSDAVAQPAAAQHRLGPARQLRRVPTDCPQRDERLGWTGRRAGLRPHRHATTSTCAASSPSGCDDVADAQLPDGAFTDVAPPSCLTGAGSAGLGRRRGDRPVDAVADVRRHRGPGPALRRHDPVDGLPAAANPDYLRTRELGNSYGDWLPGRRRHPARTARHRVLRRTTRR